MRPLRTVALAAATLLLAGCSSTASIPTSSAPLLTPVATPTTSVVGTADPSVVGSTATPTTGAISARAAAIVAGMSAQQLAGAVLMTAGTVQELRGLAATVRADHLAGLMVRGRSAAGTAAVHAAFAPARAAVPTGLPLITATDQEGGYVQVLSGPGFTTIPSANRQATLSSTTLRRDAAGWARSLHAAGVLLNLAPVAGVPCAADLHDNPPIADLDRNYGTDPTVAARQVAAFVDGMRDGGVQTTVKHFPGLGCVRGNTDTTANVVDSSTTSTSPRLAPFRAGIAAGAGFLMVSSASYSRIDAGVPALFSRTDIALARHLGFDGVVMSDDVGAAVALKSVSRGDRATRFIAAGGDLLLDVVPADLPAETKALVAAQRSASFRSTLRVAATRVVAARLALAAH